MKNYKELDAWQLATNLVVEVYKVANHFPKEEMYALTSQTKRASVSVAANIAEGVGRQYKKDTIQFLYISRGSLYELETLLVIALRLELFSKQDSDILNSMIEKSLQVLNGLINYYERSNLK